MNNEKKSKVPPSLLDRILEKGLFEKKGILKIQADMDFNIKKHVKLNLPSESDNDDSDIIQNSDMSSGSYDSILDSDFSYDSEDAEYDESESSNLSDESVVKADLPK